MSITRLVRDGRASLAALGLALLLALTSSCGSSAGPGDAGPGDAAPGDSALVDGGTGDGAPDDASRDAPGDSAAGDTAAGDGAAADAAAGDMAAADTAPGDGAAGDGSSGDDGPTRPAGQCVVDGDCTGTLTCTVTAPGGICAGCAGSCPLGLVYDCFVGSCVRNCSTDDDCPFGLRCSGGTRCALISCSGDTCPTPFTCQSGFCRRPPCSAGCPVGWTCRDLTCTER